MLAEKGFAFAFVEGALVKAVREGWWLLLDEINLAPAEVCHSLLSAAIEFCLLAALHCCFLPFIAEMSCLLYLLLRSVLSLALCCRC